MGECTLDDGLVNQFIYATTPLTSAGVYADGLGDSALLASSSPMDWDVTLERSDSKISVKGSFTLGDMKVEMESHYTSVKQLPSGKYCAEFDAKKDDTTESVSSTSITFEDGTTLDVVSRADEDGCLFYVDENNYAAGWLVNTADNIFVDWDFFVDCLECTLDDGIAASFIYPTSPSTSVGVYAENLGGEGISTAADWNVDFALNGNVVQIKGSFTLDGKLATMESTYTMVELSNGKYCAKFDAEEDDTTNSVSETTLIFDGSEVDIVSRADGDGCLLVVSNDEYVAGWLVSRDGNILLDWDFFLTC